METPIQQTQPGAPKKSRKTLILGIIGGVVGVIVLIITLSFWATSSLVKIFDQHLDYLKAGDVEAAYAQTSQAFRNVTSLEDYKSYVNQLTVLSKNSGRTYTTREIVNDTGTIIGTLKSSDGSALPFRADFIKENGEWKMYGIQIPYSQTSVR